MLVEIQGTLIEIDEADWREYQLHLEEADEWEQYIAGLIRKAKVNPPHRPDIKKVGHAS